MLILFDPHLKNKSLRMHEAAIPNLGDLSMVENLLEVLSGLAFLSVEGVSLRFWNMIMWSSGYFILTPNLRALDDYLWELLRTI